MIERICNYLINVIYGKMLPFIDMIACIVDDILESTCFVSHIISPNNRFTSVTFMLLHTSFMLLWEFSHKVVFELYRAERLDKSVSVCLRLLNYSDGSIILIIFEFKYKLCAMSIMYKSFWIVGNSAAMEYGCTTIFT